MSSSQDITTKSAWKLWQNPIFLRYCRSRLRPSSIGVIVLIDLLVAGFIVAIAISISSSTRIHVNIADAARGAVIPLMIFQGLILFVFGTAQVSGGMITERDEGVIDYQRLAPMSPLAKVLGYLFGLPSREYVLFLGTLPFSAWALWFGKVEPNIWLPLYGVILSSAVVYHLTGLVTGTVVKNRRIAFLISIGLVFSLYTVVPQAAKFGLVFFKYLTIRPVFEECLPGILPKDIGTAVQVAKNFSPTVKFFNLDFSETVFTLFTQGGLILTFIVMLCRKWRSVESHLLGKLWATVFFIWIQFLLLGNAMPLIDPGMLFPSRQLSFMARLANDWAPQASEAVLMSGLYGAVALVFMMMLTLIITPAPDHQSKGWRRARKQGDSSIPVLSDAASSYWFVMMMAISGGIGWFIFTRGLVESRWFPGHHVSWETLVYFVVFLMSAGMLFQAVLETKGKRFVGFLSVIIGIVPIMVGTVLGTISDRLVPLATWVTGISPLSMPFYASSSLLSIAEIPEHAARAMPRAFDFWLLVTLIVMIWRSVQLRAARRAMAQGVMAESPDK
jgi:hypothetical protein